MKKTELSINKHRIELSTFTLQIIAMVTMLMDHMHWTVMGDQLWLSCVGRLAFPIFAFFIAEGFSKTHDVKKYILRTMLYGALSEIPFNFMVSGEAFFPFHQNVMWCFSLALVCMLILEKLKEKTSGPGLFILSALVIIIFTLLGFITFVDYYGAGILMVLVFYYLRDETWLHRIAQLLAMYYINCEMLGGQCLRFSLFNTEFLFPIQGFAIFALPFLWLYHGKQGHSSKGWQTFKYLYYTIHIVALDLAMLFMGII